MKNFNEIYQKIYNENNFEIQHIRKTNIIRSTIISLIFIALSVPVAIYISALIAIIFDVIITLIIFLNPFFNNYIKKYKSTVISSLVKAYDNNLTFNPTAKMPRIHYDRAEFEPYTEYNANDYISGMIDGKIDFHMGDILTQYVTYDENGQPTRSTVFQGLFSASSLNKVITDTIKIRTDSKLFNKEHNSIDKLNMDSQEFEKYFNVFAHDKILAMRILTSDIMDSILTFKKENNIKFDITIRQNMLYIRIHCKNIFESNVLKNPLDFNTLHVYYKYLNFIVELNKLLNKILEEKDL